MWLPLLVSLFIGSLNAAYFTYGKLELPAASKCEMTWEELDNWTKIGERVLKEAGPTTRWVRFQAYLKMAQNDFAELGQGKGSVGYLSYQIVKLFAPDFTVSKWTKGMDDPFSKQLGEIVFDKYKRRFSEEEIKPQTLKAGGGWKGSEPYFGIDSSSLMPWYIKTESFLCIAPPENKTFWDLQMEEVDLMSSSITPDEKKTVEFWASHEGDLILMADAHMYEKNTPLLQRSKIRAVLASALSDACASCFLSKYTYMIKRPSMFQEGFKSIIETPNHPSYPSAHSTNTSALLVLLDNYLPDPKWKRLATEAGLSRIIGGIHYPIDHVNGQELGSRIGTAILNDIRQSSRP